MPGTLNEDELSKFCHRDGEALIENELPKPRGHNKLRGYRGAIASHTNEST